MSGNIIFPTLNPGQIRTGGFFIDFNAAGNPGLATGVRRVLYIGQRLATGSVPANTPTQFYVASDMTAMSGKGSMLDYMASLGVQAAKYYGAITERWFISLDDAGGAVAAAGSISLQGSNPTAAGSLAFYIHDVPVTVAVAVGDTAAAIATNVAAAINALPELMVTAAVDLVNNYQVDITARNKGLEGNNISIFQNLNTGDATPAGVAVAITAMTGGATNPSLTAAIAALGDMWFTDIIMPYTDATNLAALETELESRWGGTRQIDGTSWGAFRGTMSATDTFGQAQNSQFAQFMGTGIQAAPPCGWAAVMGEVFSASLELDPALPLKSLKLPGIRVPKPLLGNLFTWEEQNLLLHNGISTFTVDNAGNVYVQEMITSFQFNAQSIADTSYLYPETVANLSYQRYAANVKFATKFPRCKWSPVEIPVQPGQRIVTPSIFRGVLQEIGQDLQDLGLITNASEYASTAVIQTANGNNNAVAYQVDPDLMPGFRGAFGLINFQS